MASVYSGKAYDFQDFDDDDDDDEDVSDDEVFVNDKKRGGSGGGVLDEDNGVNKPLMAPRRKVKTHKLHTEVRRGTRCRTVCLPVCYVLTAIGSLIGIICLVVFLINTFVNKFYFQEVRIDLHKDLVVGCTQFKVTDVWTQNLPKLTTETAFRLVDVNEDGALDIILGFGTGADGYNVPHIVCDVYFDGKKPCFGGVLALDGRTGTEIWRHYSDHEVFALNCNEDLNNDRVRDCVAGGRAGVLQAISGKNGDLLWNFGPQDAKNDIMNVYTPQMIADQDEDGVVDVLVSHGGDPLADPGSAFRLSGRLIILSGKTGKVIQWVGVPDKRESYYSLQRLQQLDGTQLVLFGTGGETHPGALYIITLNNLMKGTVHKSIPIYEDRQKGIMTPPVIVDVNGDSVDDIVMAMFNSTVVAFDGLDFKQLWNFTFPSSETYSTPAAGFFNDDDIPDFLVKYQSGPGFPIYYYAQTTILDGRDGRPLLAKPIRDTIGSQASALTVSMEGYGNDIFLYWAVDCKGHEGEQQHFDFIKGTNVHEQSRADLCKLRFQSEMVSRIYAINAHVQPPGFAVYNSGNRKQLENNNLVNTSAIAQQYLKTHPDVAHAYRNTNKEKINKGHSHGTSGHRGKIKQTVPHSQEYEEDVPYQEVHSVRKHGRYKNYPSKSHGSIPRPEKGKDYEDYDIFGSNGQQLDPHGHPQWPNNMDNVYLRGGSRSGGRERGGRGREWKSEPYGSRGSYPGTYGSSDQDEYGLFGVQDPYPGEEQGRRYPEEQEPTWNQDVNYGIPFRKRLKRKSTKTKRSSEKLEDAPKRFRRHVGPHDMDGIQRIISTGTLVPVLDPTALNANHSIDIVFATYWFFPSKTQAILPEDRDCIQKRMGQEQDRFSPQSKYYGMDHDAYEEAITKECIKPNQSNHTYESQTDYDPFNIHMGQMTVYRLRLQCTCDGDVRVEVAGRPCAKVLPFDKQGWAAYMGTHGDGHFTSRQPPQN